MLRAKRSQTKVSPEETKEGSQKDDVAIVPLAIPLLSGPGSIATVMVLVSRAKSWTGVVSILLSIVLTFVASYFLLSGAHLVQRVLKQTGVAIMQRVMGLILAAIAVQFIAEGSKDILGLR
jgi:multiple antibiotic resistance protein